MREKKGRLTVRLFVEGSGLRLPFPTPIRKVLTCINLKAWQILVSFVTLYIFHLNGSIITRAEHGGREWAFFDPAPVKNSLQPCREGGYGAGICEYAGIPTGMK
jgi:hypothetical protein